jgi:thiol-disulfide isomerase/thioredoxin
MKITVLLFISCFLSTAQTNKNFVLKGKCPGLSNQYLYLNYDNKKDSCYIVKDEFIFKGEITNYLTNARFDLKNKFSVMSRNFYLETTEFDMDCSEKVINDYSVLYLDAKNFKGGVVNQLVIDLENISNLNKDIPNRKNKLFFKIDSIVKNYPKNDFSGDLLSILTWDETLDKEKLKIIYKKLNNKYQRESSIKTIENNLYPEKYIKIGDNVFNFKLPNQYGITFDTAELKGKYYLIDFWASWCAPCRKSFPDLIKVYDKFKNKNFDILTVSIDLDLNKWKQAILKDKILWKNVIENKDFDGEIVKKYNISYIPKNFLINPEGKIIAIEITPENLNQFLIKNLEE